MQTYRRRKIHETCNEIWGNYSLTPGFDVEELLEEMGIKYKAESLSNSISAVLIIKSGKKLVTVNSNHPTTRQRFSISHELGHLFLDHKKNFDLNEQSKIFYRDTVSSLGIDTDEIEANYFAACLLMPESEIKSNVIEFLSFEENVEMLSDKFVVSAAAMTLRLSFLGYSSI